LINLTAKQLKKKNANTRLYIQKLAVRKTLNKIRDFFTRDIN